MIKRLFDIALSLFLLIIFLPLLVSIWSVVYLFLGSPVLFSQVRPGLNKKPFTMRKFRTMKDVRGSDGNLLPDNQRMTKLGKCLRSTSLDELPELWNVLVGDMSLVGPRPLLMEYLPLYSEKQARRHEVRPGVTGWAQINGRNHITWEERFELDVWYVDNHSFTLDLKILFLTVKKVFLREGISEKGEVTMSKFNGSSEEGSK